MPDRAALTQRLSARLFGGASGGVFRGMATLALGSGIGRVIGIAAIPILTRLYTPEDFGVLAVFTSLVMILAPLVTLRYVLALPLPRHDGAALNLLAVSTCLMLILSALVAIMLWLWGEVLLSVVSMEPLTPWWWLIALGVLGTATYEMLTMWATRKRAYKMIAQTNVTQSAAGALVKIGLGLMSLQPLGLILGQVVAQAGGIGRLLRGSSADFRANWRHVSSSRIRRAAWQHRGFPIWRVPSQFLMAFSLQAPMLFMAALYEPQTAGQFGLAVMALAMPVDLLGQSAGKALYGEAALAMKTDPSKITQMALEVQFRLFFIALAPAAIIFFFGDSIFQICFGDEWIRAGSFASMLSIAIIFQFTSAPLMQLMNLLRKQSAFMAINAVRAIGLTLIFWVSSVDSLEPQGAVKLYSVFSAIFYLGSSLVVFHALRVFRAQTH
ncbi:lipopolysaccharide biosynthesis protein [Rhodobacter sp. NSM]|uniref:lipopolysaccharide biosynthesis protein n=1 Tax=Rhodobacter sp. NSM TaxID=3457501 RepID=UPI003FD3F700